MNSTDFIPYGYCQCGCGKETEKVPQTIKSAGYKYGDYYKYTRGHNGYSKNIKIEVPDGKSKNLCRCGCGNYTEYAKRTDKRLAHKKVNLCPMFMATEKKTS